tara:strand:+ start:55 stop:321 length:267 start_codon:yes stop_codon:yes gene_type:complete
MTTIIEKFDETFKIAMADQKNWIDGKPNIEQIKAVIWRMMWSHDGHTFTVFNITDEPTDNSKSTAFTTPQIDATIAERFDKSFAEHMA